MHISKKITIYISNRAKYSLNTNKEMNPNINELSIEDLERMIEAKRFKTASESIDERFVILSSKLAPECINEISKARSIHSLKFGAKTALLDISVGLLLSSKV
ncbi:MAG: hypothetical protein MHMPM18_002952 [Marteilia pararefringens]